MHASITTYQLHSHADPINCTQPPTANEFMAHKMEDVEGVDILYGCGEVVDIVPADRD